MLSGQGIGGWANKAWCGGQDTEEIPIQDVEEQVNGRLGAILLLGRAIAFIILTAESG